jgi:hypothetical protein
MSLIASATRRITNAWSGLGEWTLFAVGGPAGPQRYAEVVVAVSRSAELESAGHLRMDSVKAAQNERKHGVSFEEAIKCFSTRLLSLSTIQITQQVSAGL